jgi:hypothetical protein
MDWQQLPPQGRKSIEDIEQIATEIRPYFDKAEPA